MSRSAKASTPWGKVSIVAVSLVMILVLVTARVAWADSVISTLTLGGKPDGMAFDSIDGNIYVANGGSNSVSVIAGSNNTVVATLPVGSEPAGIVYDAANGDVYISNYGDGTVTIIATSGHQFQNSRGWEFGLL